MRLEYIVVGIILMLVVFIVIMTMLAGVVPSLQPVLDLFKSKV